MPLGLTLVTPLASTVTVHTVPTGSGDPGVSVKDAAFAGAAGERVNGIEVPPGHCSVKAVLAFTCTCSLKLIVTVVASATPLAPLAGAVVVTLGAGAVVKLELKLAAIGRPTSEELTKPARTV